MQRAITAATNWATAREKKKEKKGKKKGAARPRFTARRGLVDSKGKRSGEAGRRARESWIEEMRFAPTEFVICMPRSLTNNGFRARSPTNNSISRPIETCNKCNGTIVLHPVQCLTTRCRVNSSKAESFKGCHLPSGEGAHLHRANLRCESSSRSFYRGNSNRISECETRASRE